MTRGARRGEERTAGAAVRPARGEDGGTARAGGRRARARRVAVMIGLVRDPARATAEHSVALRAGAAGAVCIAIAACKVEGELSGWFAAAGTALVVAGSAFSYRRRTRPVPYVKVALGLAMLAAFSWFLFAVATAATADSFSSVVGPLAVLFTAMQAAHAFDMPSRRDVGFSVAGSATLMAVAAAQAVDLSFAVLVGAWAACCVVAMSAAWSSMAGGRARVGGVLAALGAALVLAAALVVVIPTPRPPNFSAAAGGGGAQGVEPARLTRPAGGGERLRPAPPGGTTGVGGYLGFAGPLDTALRTSLSTRVVLRVRADRPSYWLAETFDTWSGQSWTEPQAPTTSTPGAGWQTLTGGPPFVVDPGILHLPDGPGAPAGGIAAAGGAVPATPDYQTFYLAAGASDLVLHAETATAVWLPTRRVQVAPSGTIRSPATFGPGSVYSVLSTVATPSPAELRHVRGHAGLSAAALSEYLQLPRRYARVHALAARITAGQPSLYAKVTALERWMGGHTRYTLAIPPLGPGQDSVDQFLFGTRRGYCEQISTSLAVMLRTLGIPAREAVGYVPGPYDPLSGLYEVQAKDAHAWVQVWFPGYGWQSFDPTADVPLATPSSGSALAHEAGRVLAALTALPVVPTVPLTAVALLAAALVWWARRRPRSWRSAVTRELERAARRAGLAEDRSQTLTALARQLDEELDGRRASVTGGAPGPPGCPPRPSAVHVAAAAETAAWCGADPEPRVAREHVRAARRLRHAARQGVLSGARRSGPRLNRRPGAPPPR